MKLALSLFIAFFFSIQCFAQNSQLERIEKEIKDNAMEGKYEKQTIDLNNDGVSDVIYTYQCAEPKCIEVYLNIDGTYQQVLKEFYIYSKLWQAGKEKQLSLTLLHCCGESPYVSKRLFGFSRKSIILLENYVVINSSYVIDAEFILPEVYLPQSRFVKNTIDNYNLRFSPTVEKLSEEDKKSFTYGCEDGTNIIAKIKKDSSIKVLAELIEQERTWLFVEIEKESVSGSCNPVDFDFEGQKLRGWISGKYAK